MRFGKSGYVNGSGKGKGLEKKIMKKKMMKKKIRGLEKRVQKLEDNRLHWPEAARLHGSGLKYHATKEEMVKAIEDNRKLKFTDVYAGFQ